MILVGVVRGKNIKSVIGQIKIVTISLIDFFIFYKYRVLTKFLNGS
jgi:hypothetical protein